MHEPKHSSSHPVLPLPSNEQQEVIDGLNAGFSAVVGAVPGAGKTTLLMNVVGKFRPKGEELPRFVLVTYNNALAASTKQRVNLHFPDGCEVFTFHGVASSISGTTIRDDVDLQTFVTDFENRLDHFPDSLWAWDHAGFRMLLLDEAQDLRPDYRKLVSAILRAYGAKPKCQAVVVGDPNQLLYSFYPVSNADSKYMTLPDQFFPEKVAPWRQFSMVKSWRCPAPVTDFVNCVRSNVGMVPRDCLGDPPGCVEIRICNVYKDPGSRVLEFMHEIGNNGSRLLVLAPSLNARSPAVHVANKLANAGHPIHVARSGEITPTCRVPADTADQCVRFRTFHASKGLENDSVVVLCSGNSSLQQLFNQNSTFVALTRAKKNLLLFLHHTSVDRAGLEDLAARLDGENTSIVIQRKVFPSQVPREPKPSKAKKSLRSTFSFMDVVSVRALLKYVDTRTHPAGTLPGAIEVRDQLHQYEQRMSVLVEGTRCDVSDIVGKAMELGLYMVMTGKAHPQVFGMVSAARKFINSKEPLPLLENLDQEVKKLHGTVLNGSSVERVARVMALMPSIAKCLTLVQLNSEFQDKLHLKKYDFALHPTVCMRVRWASRVIASLTENLQGSFAVLTPRNHFQAEYITWVGETMCIALVHCPQITNETLLRVATAAALVEKEHTVLLNLYDCSAATIANKQTCSALLQQVLGEKKRHETRQ